MANLPNYVLVPCLRGVAQTATNQVNSASVFRAPTAQPTPQSASSSSSAPVGPQLWPLKL